MGIAIAAILIQISPETSWLLSTGWSPSVSAHNKCKEGRNMLHQASNAPDIANDK